MRLHQILELLNSLEKKQFLNVLESLAEKSGRRAEVESILDRSVSDALKSAEGDVITSVFELLRGEYKAYVISELENFSSHAGIFTDILSRDGGSIMSGRWFDTLYGREIAKLSGQISLLKDDFESGGGRLSPDRLRDYKIFLRCVAVAFSNDTANNLDAKITADESTILKALAQALGLSSQEVSEIIYMVVPLSKSEESEAQEYLRKSGLAFVHRKSGVIYVADEMVAVFREAHGREIAGKNYRTMLRLLKDPELNSVCKRHGLPMRGVDSDAKITSIIESGISFTTCFLEDIYKAEDALADKKKRLAEICDAGFPGIKLQGATLNDKVASILSHFRAIDNDDRVEIGKSGYDVLLRHLAESTPAINDRLREMFLFQEAQVLQSDFLLDRNIKPRDVIELMTPTERKEFCTAYSIPRRGSEVLNILDAYRKAENLLVEQFVLLANRDLAGLKDFGISIKESELGLKFEDATKQIFRELGLEVDEDLKIALNTAKDKVDILIRTEGIEVILVECKSSKDLTYTKFSSLTRQMKSYQQLINSKGYRVVKSLLVAPSFSDDFVNSVEMEYELNLTLISAESLKQIHSAFVGQSQKTAATFPHKMLAHARDVVLNADRIIKTLSK